MMRFKWRSILPLLTILNIVFVLLLLGIETFAAERFWWTTLITYVPQQGFVVPTVFLLTYALAQRNWRIFGWNVLIFVLLVTTLLGFNIPLRFPQESTEKSIRVMTYNTHHASGGAKRIAEVVKRVQPDVLCLQEVNAHGRWCDPMPELKRLLPGWHVAHHGQLATFSRYPIMQQQIHRFSIETWRVVFQTTIKVNGRQLTVLNIHLNTATRPCMVERNTFITPYHIYDASSARSSQVYTLLKVADGVNGNLIIAGDFNTPPRGRIYKRLIRKFDDAFSVSGWGMGYTYRADIPIMRIDHIFAGTGMRIKSCSVPKTMVSDHRPVVADVAFLK